MLLDISALKSRVSILGISIDISCEFDRRGVILSEEIDVPFSKIVLNVKSNGSAIASELQPGW